MNLAYYFKQAIDRGASDLHLVEGAVPSLRIAGELHRLENDEIPAGELRHAIFASIDKGTRDKFESEKDIDLSLEFYNNRFRVNLHYQEAHMGLSARLVLNKIPTPQEIDLNPIIYELTHLKDGLLLVTGPSGAGKSTTLAVMLDIINKERRAHIITVEDPIEYIFTDKQSIVEQRQLGRDTKDFSTALKYALRQDPNVIMVGEMRDKETIRAALTAAKTGHLVLSTLHTSTAAETVSRIIDYFPTEYQNQITNQLSGVLRGVVSQQLLPKRGGGLVAAREILINNNAISNLIKNNQIEQINSTIQTSSNIGMQTMNKSVDDLLRRGLISEVTATNRRRDMETHATYY
ncbi:MAG: PilT/PilU family type 4a pilus ATPase [Patescibacteria group bacterium]|jgi:twitching motility protein PilT|nr:PilT/PilU family type 4a pilus ATPase [Patescibacteria group bacterium]